MRFWRPEALLDPGILLDLALLAALIALSLLLVRAIPLLRRVGVPYSIIAGVMGLALGPSGAGVLPTDIPAMETIVYHAFAAMFIAGGLQAAPKTDRPGSARSLAVGNASIGVLQAIFGLLFVGAWLSIEPLHPGFGLMVTLGFQQGPGQALAMGGVWESQGMVDGGQIGLVFATLGFFYCIVLGVPAVMLARRRGLLAPEEEISRSPRAAEAGRPLGRLWVQLVWVGVVYALMFGTISGLVAVLPGKLGAIAWGIHFIIGSLIAIGVRALAGRTERSRHFDDPWLARIAVVMVDLTTAGAIAAVRLEVLSTWLVPILLMTLVAGGSTLLGCLWLARRAFPEAPFSHALVLFGMGTGTVSTGLALLRMLDPDLRGPVARNAIIGASASVPFNAPMFVVVIPFAVQQWSSDIGTALGGPLGMLGVYTIVLLASWRWLTPLKALRPLRSVWPPDPRPRPPPAGGLGDRLP